MRRGILSAALAMGVVFSGPAAADPVTIRGWAFQDFGRLVFDWENGANYTLSRQGDRVTLRFDRLIEGAPGLAAENLVGYLSDVALSPDGTAIAFTVEPDATVRDFDVGTAIVIDLSLPVALRPAPQPGGATAPRGPETAQTPAAPAEQPEAEASAAARIPVRTGEHPTYSRVVLDWPAQVDYQVAQEGQVARFTFPEGSALGPLGPVAGLRRFEGATLDGSTVSFTLSEGTDLRQFRNGTSVVVDAVSPQPSPTQTPPQPAGQTASQTSGEPGAQEAATPESDAPAQAAAQAGGGDAGGGDPGGGDIVGEEEAGDPPPVIGFQPLDLAEENDEALFNSVETLIRAPQDFLAEEALATAEGVPPQRLASLIDGEAAPIELDRSIAGVSVSRDLAPIAPEDLSGAPLAVQYAKEEDTVTIRFPWTTPTAAAVFVRAGYVWTAFDEQRRMDLSALREITDVVSAVEQVPSPVGSVMRFRLVSGLSPRVWRDGLNWLIDLRAQEIRTEVPLNPEVQPISPQGPRLFIPVSGVGESIPVVDPEVGDQIFVIPIDPLGRGSAVQRNFAEFKLLKSVQGLAVQPLSEDVTIRELPDGVAVTKDGGLFLTKDLQRQDTFGEQGFGSEQAFAQGRPYPLEEWRLVNEDSFYRAKQDIQREVAEAISISRTRPRMKLARFFFAHGLTAETLGVLRTVAAEDPEFSNTPEFKSLRGGALYAFGREDAAREDLADRALDGNREVELWRGAAAGAVGDWGQAAEHFARAGEIPGDYPRNYTTEIALIAAEAAIRVGDNRGAGVFLDIVAEGSPSKAEAARIDYLRGRVLSAVGDVEGAYSLWEPLAAGEDRWSRVRAARALVEEDLRQGKIGKEEAIQKLEDLRFAWRGDRLEFDLLRRLGGLYLDAGDFRSGLNTLKEATSLFPSQPETPLVTEQMTNAFARLYLDGQADRLSPLTALSLFEDFRELTPVGTLGNEMIRRLSDRLVSVDLLDRAGSLLERQIEFRLEGLDKARVGAQLALIRLLDRNASGAVDALDSSVAPRLPERLALERRRLRARALADQDQPAEALELLEGDDSRDANLLRADINWRRQSWSQAAEAFSRLADDLPSSGLGRQEAALVLNWAVAASLSDDPQGVQLIRRRFGNAMDQTAAREAFRLITAGSGQDLGDFTQVADRFQEIRQFQGFLNSYRDRLSDRGLSAIN
ncbi:MAG: hypothetical protein NXI16_12325 [Alphaproteobacteria bacterium]|nr:hypothetical protein [Alphaproteobacteria bacterium]